MNREQAIANQAVLIKELFDLTKKIMADEWEEEEMLRRAWKEMRHQSDFDGMTPVDRERWMYYQGAMDALGETEITK